MRSEVQVIVVLVLLRHNSSGGKQLREPFLPLTLPAPPKTLLALPSVALTRTSLPPSSPPKSSIDALPVNVQSSNIHVRPVLGLRKQVLLRQFHGNVRVDNSQVRRRGGVRSEVQVIVVMVVVSVVVVMVIFVRAAFSLVVVRQSPPVMVTVLIILEQLSHEPPPH